MPRRQFALQRGAYFGTFSDVRMFLTLTTLVSIVATTSAQEQEGKLVDRLLRPNMALANSAQNKQFVIATGTTVDKRAPAKSFYTPEKSLAKSFPGERAFSPKQFAVRHFRTGDSTANISARSQLTRTDTVYAVPATPGTRAAAESDRSVAATSFAGNRPFLDRGKSQKALSAHDMPLTLEQVRELLNKNK